MIAELASTPISVSDGGSTRSFMSSTPGVDSSSPSSIDRETTSPPADEGELSEVPQELEVFLQTSLRPLYLMHRLTCRHRRRVR